MTPEELRARFPVTAGLAYLNAGTCGPLPAAARDAMRAAVDEATASGRAGPHFERLGETTERLRAAYARVIGAHPRDVAITTATSDGIARVLLALDLRPGDEIVVAEREHPGLLGPLGAMRSGRGVAIRVVPMAAVGDAVGPATRLVACSHVSWTTGELAPDLSGLDVPVLLDGAQGAGAVPVEVEALGCAFYAAAGQKWLCGPVGTGLLYVAPEWRERLIAAAPTFVNLAAPARGLAATPWDDARAHDAPALSLEAVAGSLAALETLEEFGWPAVHDRGRALAARLAGLLRERGRSVAPRGDTTLVSWESPDPAAEVARHGEAGVITRSFADLPYVRASTGAWNDDGDLERLIACA